MGGLFICSCETHRSCLWRRPVKKLLKSMLVNNKTMVKLMKIRYKKL